MNRIRKGDIVKVISGKDRGKTGKVLRVFGEEERALVEGINMYKKAMRRTQENQKGGLIDKEVPLHMAKLMPICKSCGKTSRVRVSELKDKTRARVCGRCKNSL